VLDNRLFAFQIKASFGINHFQVKYFDEDNEEVMECVHVCVRVCVRVYQWWNGMEYMLWIVFFYISEAYVVLFLTILMCQRYLADSDY